MAVRCTIVMMIRWVPVVVVLCKHHPYHMLSTAVRISAEYFTYGIEDVDFGAGRQVGPSVD